MVKREKPNNHSRSENNIQKTNEAKYQDFIKYSAEGIYLIEFLPPISIDLPPEEQVRLGVERGIIAECNDAIAQMYGFSSREEMLGMPYIDFYTEEGISENMEANVKIIKDGYKSTDIETEEYNKDGEKTYFLNNAVGIIKDGYYIGVWGTQRDITELKRVQEKLSRQIERLQSLRRIDLAITSSISIKKIMALFVEEVAVQLNVDAVSVLLMDNEQRLKNVAGYGFIIADALKYTNLAMGQGLAGLAVTKRRIVHVDDLQQRKDNPDLITAIANEGFVSYYGVPLIAKDHVYGVLEVFNRSTFAPSTDWMDFFETLAGQAAIAVDNTTLFNDLETSNRELNFAYDATLEGWSSALELRDEETEGHTQRVTEIMNQLAGKFDFNKEELVHIKRGTLLHDIGKMGIPDSILHKPGPLTDEEWVIMKKHPEYAYTMLNPIEFLQPALDIPHLHHERWNGSGYPQGLKGDEIPYPARLFAIVDAWDALLSDRPYRKAWSKNKVIKFLQAEAGILFDPQIVKVFLELVKEKAI